MAEIKPRFCSLCGQEIDLNPCGTTGTLLAFRCPADGLTYTGAAYAQVGLESPQWSVGYRLSNVASNQVMFMPIGGVLNE